MILPGETESDGLRVGTICTVTIGKRPKDNLDALAYIDDRIRVFIRPLTSPAYMRRYSQLRKGSMVEVFIADLRGDLSGEYHYHAFLKMNESDYEEEPASTEDSQDKSQRYINFHDELQHTFRNKKPSKEELAEISAKWDLINLNL